MSPNKLLAWYCTPVFAVSWALQIAVILLIGDPENPAAAPWLAAGMFAPGIIAIVLTTLHRPSRAGFLWKPTFRMLALLPFAVLVPTAIAFAVTALAITLGWATSGWFIFKQTGVSVAGGPWLLGVGQQSWLWFIMNVVATGAAFSAMNGLVAAGEELGWRGYLQGVLIARLGALHGITLLGLMWSLWHLPVQLAGYNYPDHPLLGSFVLSPLELVGISFFLGWLTLRSGSFWPAAIAHGAGNSIQEGVTQNLQMLTPRLYEDLATVALTVCIGLLCLVLIQRPQDRREASVGGARPDGVLPVATPAGDRAAP